jgi:hypothetical protein
MVEKDLMQEVASIVDQRSIPIKRLTTSRKQVYRITVQARAKTEVVLKAILPYIVGEKTMSKIQELLQVCEQYKIWLNSGGRKFAAKHATKLKKTKTLSP